MLENQFDGMLSSSKSSRGKTQPDSIDQGQSAQSRSSFSTSLSDFRLPASSSNSSDRTAHDFNFNSNHINSSSTTGNQSSEDKVQRFTRRSSLLGVTSGDSERSVRAKDRWGERKASAACGNVQDGDQGDTEMDDGEGGIGREDHQKKQQQSSISAAENLTSNILRPRNSYRQQNQKPARPSLPFRPSSPSPRPAHPPSNQSFSSFNEMRRPRSFSGSSDIAMDTMQVDQDGDVSVESRERRSNTGSGRVERLTTPPASASQADSSSSNPSIPPRRAFGRKPASSLPRDKSVLRVAATLKDESKPEDSELASEAKLQRRLGELSLPTSPVARSASASSGFEKGAGMWGWTRARGTSPFVESSRSRRGTSVIDGDIDLAYGIGYGGSDDGIIESDDSSDELETSPPPPLPSSMVHPFDRFAQSNNKSVSVPPTATKPQLIDRSNQNFQPQSRHDTEEEIEMVDGNNCSTHLHPTSLGGGSSFPNSTSNFALSTSAGRNSSLWTDFRDNRRSKTPASASVLTNGHSSSNASPGIGGSTDAMDVEGVVASLERTVKRKYVSEERFEPYANSANKRRAVSPSLGLALRGPSSFSSSSPSRREDVNHSAGISVASPSLLATSSYIHGSSPLYISTTSSGPNHALPVPTPLSIPSPTTPFTNPAPSSAATHYFSNQHVNHRRSSSATSLKDITIAAFNPILDPSTSTTTRSSDLPATRPSTPNLPTSSLAVSTPNPSGSASAGPSPSLLATSASGSGSGPGYIRSGALGLSLSGNSKARKGTRRRSTNTGAGLGMRTANGSGGNEMLLDDDEEGEEMDQGVRMLGLS